MKSYSLPWAVGLVSTVHETYARATDYLQDLLAIDSLTIARLFLEDRLDWYRYKKLLRTLEELLHSRIVPNPEKVFKAWQVCQISLDTKNLRDILAEPEKIG